MLSGFIDLAAAPYPSDQRLFWGEPELLVILSTIKTTVGL
jgi:hypothetical protein